MNSDWLHRLGVLVVGLICVVGNVQATAKDYYYRATANVSPSGSGRVYVSSTSTRNPAYQSAPMSINGVVTGFFGNKPNQTVYFYATPNATYAFLGWIENGTGDYVSTSPSFSPQKQITSESTADSKRTQFNYTAYFQKVEGLVQAVSTNVQRGWVEISNINNRLNDKVTITAHPDIEQGIVFLGWKKTQSDDAAFVTSDNPYTLTVTQETAGTYYAYFSEPATKVYCILKNHETGKFLCFAGNGSATQHTATKTVKVPFVGNVTETVQDGFNFVNGLTTISESDAVNNPLIVFKRVATTGNQGQELGYLATDVYMKTGNKEGAISTDEMIGNTNYHFTFTPSSKYSNAYRISTSITQSVSVGLSTYTATFDSYLRDNGDGSVSMLSFEDVNTATNIDWDVTFLTEEQTAGAFGVTANARFESGGKYYTSMYAPFAYKLLDGVNAYYLHPDEDNYNEKTNTLTLTQIASGNVVPENMAVIIECNSANDPSGNRLLPVDEYTLSDVQKTEYAKNLLSGYNQVYSRNGYTDDVNKKYQAVDNVHDYMYVFSIKNNNLGFYHLNGATIPKNKAYLHLHVTFEDISEELNQKANNVKLAFGSQFDDDLLNSINWTNEEADDIDQPIFNLQGVQVKNPEKGIYISGGKKYLVK